MMLQAVLAALLTLGAPKDVAPEVASAVVKYAQSPSEAAFLLAWGTSESHFARRIAENDCKRWECDHGRARGLWQSHRAPAGTAWEHLPGNVELQAFVAEKHAHWALSSCKGDARCAFRLLGGLRYDVPLKGEDKRVADYEAALRRLQ